jgi:hypothetical protein
MRRPSTTTLGLLLLCLSLAAQPAGAALITQTGGVSGAFPVNQTISFDKFDTSLGTLNSVLVYIELTTIGGYYGATNLSETDPNDVTANFDLDLSTGADWTVPGSSNFWIDTSLGSATANYGESTSQTLPPSGQFSKSIDGVTADSLTTIDSFYNTYYQASPGDTTFDLTFLGETSHSATGTGSVETIFQSPTGSTGSVRLEYDYTPTGGGGEGVPEPATMLLLASGLAGMAWLRRGGLMRRPE